MTHRILLLLLLTTGIANAEQRIGFDEFAPRKQATPKTLEERRADLWNQWHKLKKFEAQINETQRVINSETKRIITMRQLLIDTDSAISVLKSQVSRFRLPRYNWCPSGQSLRSMPPRRVENHI